MDVWATPKWWEVTIMWLIGLFGMLAPLAFFGGVLFEWSAVMMAGGIAVVAQDLLGVLLGILNPVFPVLLATLLTIVIDPWYVGVFWASAVFALLGVPFHLLQLIAPARAAERALNQSRWF